MSQVCEVWHPGRLPYATALAWQNRLVAARSAGDAPDRLLLLDHPPTYTLGSSGKEDHLLMAPAERERRGVTVHHVDRGGDITYHGPGQLVGYPIIQLPRSESGGLRADFVGYLRDLETVIIRALADFGIHGRPIPGLTGVWVDRPEGPAKICAIGVKINVRAVTKHGFALNIHPDMSYFDGIVPCGIADKDVTSMAALLDAPPARDAVAGRVVTHFGEVFDYEMTTAEPSFEF